MKHAPIGTIIVPIGKSRDLEQSIHGLNKRLQHEGGVTGAVALVKRTDSGVGDAEKRL